MLRRLLILVALMALARPAISATDASAIQARTLRWVKRVCVVVDLSSSSDSFNQAITEDAIKTQVELRLRQAGVAVIDKDAYPRSRDAGIFDIAIYVVEIPGMPAFAIAVDTTLSQALWRVVAGKPIDFDVAITWQFGGVLTRGLNVLQSEGAAGLVGDNVDHFLNDWLSVHPR